MLLLHLPQDTLELIAEALDDRPDLLSLALTCSTWKCIIIPRHLEYREILLSVDHLYIWKHLAERPSLAANVRRLVISDSEFYHPGIYLTPITGSRWQLPATLLSHLPGSSSSSNQPSEYPFIALRNMRLLKTLEFENIYRWCQGSPDILSFFLAHIPTVEHLVLRSSRSHGAEAETTSEDSQVCNPSGVHEASLLTRFITATLGAPQPQVCGVDWDALGEKISPSLSFCPAIHFLVAGPHLHFIHREGQIFR